MSLLPPALTHPTRSSWGKKTPLLLFSLARPILPNDLVSCLLLRTWIWRLWCRCVWWRRLLRTKELPASAGHSPFFSRSTEGFGLGLVKNSRYVNHPLQVCVHLCLCRFNKSVKLPDGFSPFSASLMSSDVNRNTAASYWRANLRVAVFVDYPLSNDGLL